jgi:hypothetical protein
MLAAALSPALAQSDAPAPSPGDAGACAASQSTLPTALAGWATRSPITATSDAAGLARATLSIGRAADAALRPTAEVRYAMTPEKGGEPASYGGMFAFPVEAAGAYRVALGSGAWVDVVKGARAVASIAHGHCPDYSGIAKMVDFSLTPGRYTLQITANAEPTLSVLIAPRP